MRSSAVIASIILASSHLVAGHGAIVKAVGDQGGQGSAIGIDPNTPRDGTRRQPFQQDSTRFKGDAADTCGETLGGGDNNVESGTAQVMQLNGGTLPQVSAGGSLMMTMHQVNGDGAGPFTCMIDASGTGTNWQQIQVTQNVPGNARGRSDADATDQPLTVAMPAGQTCTGTVAGQSNVCMVRCQNPARAGPFGGCVPVQMVNAAGAAGGAANGTAAAPAAGAGAAAPAAGAAGAAGAGTAGAAGAGTGATTGAPNTAASGADPDGPVPDEEDD